MLDSAERDVEPAELFTDEELTALALAGNPDVAADEDALPLRELMGPGEASLLPEWYMPPTMAGARLRGWRRRVALLIVASFVLISAYGLCSTYGFVVPA
jgi:hypothetical protein